MTPQVRPSLVGLAGGGLPVGMASQPDGNLLDMGSFTTQQKLEFIRAWRSSGLSQERYCALRRDQGGGPSPRCLRAWMATLLKPPGLHAAARGIVARAVEDLHDILQALDAVRVEQAERRSESDCVEAAVRSRPATGTAASSVADPAATECRSAIAPDASGASGTVDVIAAVVQAAVTPDVVEAAPARSREEEPAALRPVPFIDPWRARFLGRF